MKRTILLLFLFVLLAFGCTPDDNAIPENPDPENSPSEIFFSEYIEGTGHNKALEIVNLTGETIDLSAYSIKKKTNGGGDWTDTLDLSGELSDEAVLVIINQQAELEKIQNEADISVNAPLNFNGNDPVGLFKNGGLIDVIGNPGGKDFAKDQTLRRKKGVSGPTTDFDLDEWEIFAENTVENIGEF